MSARIIDRGRGPEIEGTRITVYDVVDYWHKGWQHDQIAGLFRLPPDDIREAIRYIEQHRDEVLNDYQKIVDRHRNHRYSAEVQAKLSRAREKFKAKLARMRTGNSIEDQHAGDRGGS